MKSNKQFFLLFIMLYASVTVSAQVVGTPYLTDDSYNIGSGAFYGKTCFDVALGNDSINGCGSLRVRQEQHVDFSLRTVQDPVANNYFALASGAQVYTFVPKGVVSNVRFSVLDNDGNIVESFSPNGDYSGINISTPCKVTVYYKPSLNTHLEGLTYTTGKKVKITVTYNDAPNLIGTDQTITLTARFQDAACCGAKSSGGAHWLDFMCHNLGADTSLDPFTPPGNIGGLNGDYYKWGSIDKIATVDTQSGPIAGWVRIYPPNITVWNDSKKTATDPCPEGFKVPSQSQWIDVANTSLNIQKNVITSGSFGRGKKFGNLLLLPASGARSYANGALVNRNNVGYYWSSTINTSIDGAARALIYDRDQNASATTPGGELNDSFPVRCVAE